MRKDVKEAMRGRWLTFIGAHRELRRLAEYLYDDEEVHDLLACSFGTTGGRALLVVTDERVIAYKDGWIFKNSQAMSYKDIGTVEISTGLFFGKMKLKGEGMHFEISKAGRFSADHAAKMIRSRIGSRYPIWEAQRLRNREPEQFNAAATTKNELPPFPHSPIAKPNQPEETHPFYETEERLTLDRFLPPLPKEAGDAPLPPHRDGLIDELERLDALRKSGSLTEEEYAAAKHKLLY